MLKVSLHPLLGGPELELGSADPERGYELFGAVVREGQYG